MKKTNFTPEEVQVLRENPNVLRVSDNRITYTRAFKVHLVDEYRKGKRPTQIFREAGFDTKVLGYKRIERAVANWKETYERNALLLEMGKEVVEEDTRIWKEEEYQLMLAKMMKEMEALKEQLSMLSALFEVDPD